MNVDELKRFIGMNIGTRKMDYTWRDAALYALSVGAKADELFYTYEKGMKALPTFASSAYWNGQFNMTPQFGEPYCPYVAVREFSERDLGKWPGGTHMDHEFILCKPFDPIKGTFIMKDKILDIYDRGEGKGVMVRTEVLTYDESGQPVCINRGGHLLSAYGGFGGRPVPKPEWEIPKDREPDFVLEDALSETQNLLYRLTSDTLPAHVDAEYAKTRGWKAPIMQGLCNQGYAARLCIRAVCPGEPERMKRIYVQFRAFCYVGAKLKFVAWKTENPGVIVFQLLNAETGERILDRGVFEWA